MRYVYLCFVDRRVDKVSCFYATKEVALAHAVDYLKMSSMDNDFGKPKLKKCDDIHGFWLYTINETVELYEAGDADSVEFLTIAHEILISRKVVIDD